MAVTQNYLQGLVTINLQTACSRAINNSTVIAKSRQHPRFKTIFTLNILIGWTGLGWVVVLIWSFIK